MLKNSRILEYLPKVIMPALAETIYMLFFSVIFGGLIGIMLGVLLVRWSPRGLKSRKISYNILDTLISMIRSFPTIIFIVVITPLTRTLVKTSIGTKAAIIPLTLAISPVFARIVENSLLSVDPDVIVAAKSFGANTNEIIFYVMFPEAMHIIISNMTVIVINALNATAVAGAVGGGGLGSVALNYGYQRFDDIVMYTVVFILLILVSVIQRTGDYLTRKVIE